MKSTGSATPQHGQAKVYMGGEPILYSTSILWRWTVLSEKKDSTRRDVTIVLEERDLQALKELQDLMGVNRSGVIRFLIRKHHREMIG